MATPWFEGSRSMAAATTTIRRERQSGGWLTHAGLDLLEEAEDDDYWHLLLRTR